MACCVRRLGCNGFAYVIPIKHDCCTAPVPFGLRVLPLLRPALLLMQQTNVLVAIHGGGESAGTRMRLAWTTKKYLSEASAGRAGCIHRLGDAYLQLLAGLLNMLFARNEPTRSALIEIRPREFGTVYK